MSDLISRQAAIDAVRKGCQEWRGIFQRCEENIKAIEAEPIKHGHWIYEGHTGHPSEPYYSCSECKYVCYERNANYCPHCGARMDEVEE